MLRAILRLRKLGPVGYHCGNMLELDDPRWGELRHAYGSASDIPALLRQLQSDSPSVGRIEPWFTLWSSLAHQGDVYPASFAAVPHIIRAFAGAPTTSDVSFLHFPAWVEICRQRDHVPVPDFVAAEYFASLSQLPSLIAAAASRDWDDGYLACALAALAAVKGHGIVGAAVLELNADNSQKFLDWLNER
jgi:hypothetical protein